MDILVIEGAAPRRVAVAQYLLRAMHRVTISSSIDEAREILQFITKKSEAPDAVVIGDWRSWPCDGDGIFPGCHVRAWSSRCARGSPRSQAPG